MEELSVELNVPIPIPNHLILIKKVDYQEMQKEKLSGTWWSMKNLEARLNKKSEWIKENILFPSRFRENLDVKNGGFVYYPENQGQVWAFQANRMSGFLDDNFAIIFNK